MVGPSERREIAQACLILPLYVQYGTSESLSEMMAHVSYASQEAQAYLCKVTEPCFSKLKCLYSQLSQDGLVEMRKNRDEATKVYGRLERLKRSRAKIPKNEREAFETIELKIETCLNEAEVISRALADAVFRVGRDLSDMRELLDAYDALLQHLENCSKIQHYQQLVARLEEEYSECCEHPIRRLNINQMRSELLENLRRKRWREKEEYQPTRADMLEALYMGW